MNDPARTRRAAWTAALAATLSTVLSTMLSIALSPASSALAAAEAVEDTGAALLGLSAYGIWRWLRRRRRPRVLLPFEIALQRLEEMRALMQPSQAREFSIAVSDVVRRYIEERFGVTATHRTTEEFLHDLLESSHAPLARHRALLAEFLQQCDLVKFAGMSLTLQNMESLHHSARAFVLETAKPDAAAAHGAPPPAPETAHA
jgi:hypothetical protein